MLIFPFDLKKISGDFLRNKITSEKKPLPLTDSEVVQKEINTFISYLNTVRNSLAYTESQRYHFPVSEKKTITSLIVNFLLLSNVRFSGRNYPTESTSISSFQPKEIFPVSGENGLPFATESGSTTSYGLNETSYRNSPSSLGLFESSDTVVTSAAAGGKRQSIKQRGLLRRRREDKSRTDLKSSWEDYVTDSLTEVQNIRLTMLMKEKNFLSKNVVKPERVELVVAVNNYISRENVRGLKEVADILYSCSNIFLLDTPGPSSYKEYQDIFRKWFYQNIIGTGLSDFVIKEKIRDPLLSEMKMCKLHRLTRANYLNKLGKIHKIRFSESVLRDFNALSYALMKQEFVYYKFCNVQNSVIENININDIRFFDIFTSSQYMNKIGYLDYFDIGQILRLGEKMWDIIVENIQPLILPDAFHFPTLLNYTNSSTTAESITKKKEEMLSNALKSYIKLRTEDNIRKYDLNFKTALKQWSSREQCAFKIVKECQMNSELVLEQRPFVGDEDIFKEMLDNLINNGVLPCNNSPDINVMYSENTAEIADIWQKVNLPRIIHAFDNISTEELNFIFSKDTTIRSFHPEIQLNTGIAIKKDFNLEVNISDSVLFSVLLYPEDLRVYALKYNAHLTTCQLYRIDFNFDEYIAKGVIEENHDCKHLNAWCEITEKNSDELEDIGQSYAKFIGYLSVKSRDLFYKKLYGYGYNTHSADADSPLTPFIANQSATEYTIPQSVPFIRPLANMISRDIIKDSHHYYLDFHSVNYNATFTEDRFTFLKKTLPSLNNDSVTTNIYLNDRKIDKLFQVRLVNELERDNKTKDLGEILRPLTLDAYAYYFFEERYGDPPANGRIGLHKVSVIGKTEIYTNKEYNSNIFIHGSNLMAKDVNGEFVALDNLSTSVHLSDELMGIITEDLYENEVNNDQLGASDIMGLRWLDENHAYIRYQGNFIRVYFDGGQPYFSKGNKYILLYIKNNQFYPQTL